MNVKLSNAAYNVLKGVAQIWLPALGTLYVALALIWHLPAADDVSKTVVAVDTFLGVVLSISTASYNANVASNTTFDGTLALMDHPDGGAMVRIKDLDAEALTTKNSVTFRIVDQTTPEAPDVAAPPPQGPPNRTDPRLLT